jgi:hypothetical protein
VLIPAESLKTQSVHFTSVIGSHVLGQLPSQSSPVMEFVGGVSQKSSSIAQPSASFGPSQHISSASLHLHGQKFISHSGFSFSTGFNGPGGRVHPFSSTSPAQHILFSSSIHSSKQYAGQGSLSVP